MAKRKRGLVLIPDGYKPRKEELWAAHAMAEFYDTCVEFLVPKNRYKEHTPDFLVNGVPHELKTPASKSVNKIHKRIASGYKQADIIIVSMYKSKISLERMEFICRNVFQYRRQLKKIILLLSEKVVLEIKP